MPQQIADAFHDVRLVGKAEPELGCRFLWRLRLERGRYIPNGRIFHEKGVAEEQRARGGGEEEGVQRCRGQRLRNVHPGRGLVRGETRQFGAD